MGAMMSRRVTVTLEVETKEALHELRRKDRWNAALAGSTLGNSSRVLQAQANVIVPRTPKAMFHRHRTRTEVSRHRRVKRAGGR